VGSFSLQTKPKTNQMSNKTEAQTPLEVCNLAAVHGLKKAWAIYKGKSSAAPAAPAAQPKLTTEEKKAEVVESIKEAGGSVPDEGASLKALKAALAEALDAKEAAEIAAEEEAAAEAEAGL
tara:strand:- start:18305 stop:18667 length:363 start_codon:yes stop_codon:yes gene_type:complete